MGDRIGTDTCLGNYYQSTVTNPDGSTSDICRSLDANITLTGDIYKIVQLPGGGHQPFRNNQEIEVVVLVERDDGSIDSEPVTSDFFTGSYNLNVTPMSFGDPGSVRSLIIAAFPTDIYIPDYNLESSVGSISVDYVEGQSNYNLPRLYIENINQEPQLQ